MAIIDSFVRAKLAIMAIMYIVQLCTFQGSRGLQSLQTQSGEAGSQGNPLYKKDMLTNFSALTNRFLSKYFVYIPQNVNLNACVLTFDENM